MSLVRLSGSTESRKSRQTFKILVIYGILVFVSALQEVKKWVVVSCSSLHRGHISALLLPAVLQLESLYRLTNSCALAVALRTVRGLWMFAQTGWSCPIAQFWRFISSMVDMPSASVCNLSVHSLYTACLTVFFQAPFFGGSMNTSYADGNLYSYNSCLIRDAQLEEELSFMANCLHISW